MKIPVIFAQNMVIMGKSLEEEISQKNFRNIQQKVQLNILYTASWIEHKHAQIFKKYGLSNQQYNVLRILRGALQKPCTIQMIRERMIDQMSDTSRIVERLRKSGLIERTVSTSDRRSAQVNITKKGLDLLGTMEQEEQELDAISGVLSNNEADLLNSLLDKIRS